MVCFRKSLWLLLVRTMLIPPTGLAAEEPHPSELCIATDPFREHRFVRDQIQLLEAFSDPNVACVLVNQTIKLTKEAWGPESLMFKGKGCIRYGWPFCAHQVLTHTVAVAPAPGLLDTEAELHYPTGTLYSTYLEFLGAGRCSLIGMRAFGLLDLEDLGISRGLELLGSGEGSEVDFSKLQVELDIPLDARNVFGGNAGIYDSTVFIHCGPRHQLVLQLFALGYSRYTTFNSEKGEVYVTGSVAETLDEGQYTIDPYHPTAKHAEIGSSSVDIEMHGATFSCCERLEDSGADGTCTPRGTAESQGSVQYNGHQYTLLPKYRNASQAEAGCASSLDAELASFASMAELYEVTKALFISDDGVLLRTLRLTLWVSKEQSRDLDLHWTHPKGLGDHIHHEGGERMGQDDVVVGVTDCVAVDVISQLLLYQECKQAAPYICQHKLPESIVQTPPPPPPRRYLNPSNSSSGGEAFPQVALVAVLVAAGLLVSCALMVCYPAWKKARLEAQAESADLDGFMQNNVTHLKDQPFANNGAVARTSTMEAELEMEGKVVRMPVNQLRSEFEKLLMETTKHPQESPGSNGSDPRESGHNSSSQMVYSNSKNPAPPKQYPLFDGYEVIRELGKGTHATCYLTKDPTMQLWAIKVPRSDHTTVKVVQEAYFLQLIDHANVVAHKQTIVRQGKIVLVTEFCDKGDLHTLLRKVDRPFSERFVRHALLQCAMGLSRMHACNIAHRDVKPANILLKSGALFKLADLGASCMILDTEHTSFTGTPLFMAPEVLAGEAQAVQTDIYSLGCVGYMMCMLKTPYKSKTVDGLRETMKHNMYEEIHADMFSEELIDYIESMLLPHPSQRPTAEDICNLDWLFRYCCDDYEAFSMSGGGYHSEIVGRGSTVFDSAQQS